MQPFSAKCSAGVDGFGEGNCLKTEKTERPHLAMLTSLPERGLLIREQFLSLILSRVKKWEIRGAPTKVRGRIALIQSGSGLIVGECEIKGCEGPLDLKTLRNSVNLWNGERTAHASVRQLPYVRPNGASRTFAWVLGSPKQFAMPIPYRHPLGAVVFVDLTKPGVIERSTRK